MVEIDDYKNYEKALGALNEALKCMSKAKMKDFNAQERRVSTLQTRIEVVKRFTSIKRLAVESPPDMLVEARRLLDEPDLDEVVRLGDIFGLMIDQKAAAEDYSAAYELMQEMRDRIPKVNIAYYVNMRVIEVRRGCSAAGVPAAPLSPLCVCVCVAMFGFTSRRGCSCALPLTQPHGPAPRTHAPAFAEGAQDAWHPAGPRPRRRARQRRRDWGGHPRVHRGVVPVEPGCPAPVNLCTLSRRAPGETTGRLFTRL